MPASKKALLRYQILNDLLKNRNGYTIIQLTERVNAEMSTFQVDGEADRTVSDRMIRHDLENMMEIYPVQISRNGIKYYYENSEESIDNINLSEEDKTAINLALGVFSRFRGTDIYDKFSDVITRIMANSVMRKIYTAETKNIVQVAEASPNAGIEWLEKIYDAIVEKKTLQLAYKNFEESISTRTISPYMLKEYRNKWYMIAYVHGLNKPDKTLLHKLSRILNIQDGDEAYEEDRSFDGNKYFKHTLGVFHKHGEEPICVKLRLLTNSIIKLFSEDILHVTQEIIPIKDNEVILQMQVYNTPELETLILGFGEQIEVLEPIVLKDKIFRRITDAYTMYTP